MNVVTQEERQRALEAAELLDSQVFREAVRVLDGRYVNAWRGAGTPEERELWWLRQHVLVDVQREFLEMVTSVAVRSGGKDEQLNAALKRAGRQYGRTVETY